MIAPVFCSSNELEVVGSLRLPPVRPLLPSNLVFATWKLPLNKESEQLVCQEAETSPHRRFVKIIVFDTRNLDLHLGLQGAHDSLDLVSAGGPGLGSECVSVLFVRPVARARSANRPSTKTLSAASCVSPWSAGPRPRLVGALSGPAVPGRQRGGFLRSAAVRPGTPHGLRVII